MKETTAKIFCALDLQERSSCRALLEGVAPYVDGFKVGSIFFTSFGPAGVKELKQTYPNHKLFLDLKWHDIPHTVRESARLSTLLSPFMVTVHTMGGKEIMQAALEGVQQRGGVEQPLVLGVTVLTSSTIGSPKEVTVLAQSAYEVGLDGIVCGAGDLCFLPEEIKSTMVKVTPGIRMEGERCTGEDQKRVLTGKEAVRAGSDYLIIGRPFTGAKDPALAARRFRDSLVEEES